MIEIHKSRRKYIFLYYPFFNDHIHEVHNNKYNQNIQKKLTY